LPTLRAGTMLSLLREREPHQRRNHGSAFRVSSEVLPQVTFPVADLFDRPEALSRGLPQRAAGASAAARNGNTTRSKASGQSAMGT
jgi:hypothetical protein